MAALAGAYGLAQGADVRATVAGDLARNASFPFTGTVIENAPTSGPHAGSTSAAWSPALACPSTAPPP